MYNDMKWIAPNLTYAIRIEASFLHTVTSILTQTTILYNIGHIRALSGTYRHFYTKWIARLEMDCMQSISRKWPPISYYHYCGTQLGSKKLL